MKLSGEASYTIDQEINISCTASDVTSSVNGTPCDKPLLQVKAYTLEPGTHTVTAEAEDLAGHKQTVQFNFEVYATYDSLASISDSFMEVTGAPGAGGIANITEAKADGCKSGS